MRIQRLLDIEGKAFYIVSYLLGYGIPLLSLESVPQ